MSIWLKDDKTQLSLISVILLYSVNLSLLQQLCLQSRSTSSPTTKQQA